MTTNAARIESRLKLHDQKAKLPTLITADNVVAEYTNKLETLAQRARALWAAQCAERVLHFFESEHPTDDRPCRAIEGARAWARGDISMMDARKLASAAHAAARTCTRPTATAAARATGHAVATAHARGHARAAASYALLAIALKSPEKAEKRMMREQKWQEAKLAKYRKETRPSAPHSKWVVEALESGSTKTLKIEAMDAAFVTGVKRAATRKHGK